MRTLCYDILNKQVYTHSLQLLQTMCICVAVELHVIFFAGSKNCDLRQFVAVIILFWSEPFFKTIIFYFQEFMFYFVMSYFLFFYVILFILLCVSGVLHIFFKLFVYVINAIFITNIYNMLNKFLKNICWLQL